MRLRSSAAIGLTALLIGAPNVGGVEQTTVLRPAPNYRIETPLTGSDGEEAQDISGIACLPPQASETTRRCVVVNDEGRSVQLATIGDGSLAAAGAPIAILGDAPQATTLGRAPDIETCRKRKPKFDELDGEGVAYEAPFFYVVGSHGCSRKKGKFELSAFVLARLRLDAGGRVAMVETTYRLADALARAPFVEAYFGQALDEATNGLNIEGIAVVGGRLFAGLRGPSIDGKAFLVSVAVADLFNPGHDALGASQSVDVIPMPLGQGAGVRDLSVLPDGRLLVLAGPAQEQPDVPYTLSAVEPRKGGTLTPLGTLAPLAGEERKGKAEAVTPLGPDRVLVLFDSLPSGAPREYWVKLR